MMLPGWPARLHGQGSGGSVDAIVYERVVHRNELVRDELDRFLTGNSAKYRRHRVKLCSSVSGSVQERGDAAQAAAPAQGDNTLCAQCRVVLRTFQWHGLGSAVAYCALCTLHHTTCASQTGQWQRTRPWQQQQATGHRPPAAKWGTVGELHTTTEHHEWLIAVCI